jgi:Flp pilus assembly protein TadG
MKKNKYSKNERGQALILITFAIIGLIGFVGLVVDGGMAYSDHRHAQNAADSAAYAAALAYVTTTADKDLVPTKAARDIASLNGYEGLAQSNNTVTVTSLPFTSGSLPEKCPNNAGGIEFTVEITTHFNTTFARVVGINQMTSKVFAKSRACDTSGTVSSGPVYSGNSIFATKPIDDCKGNEKNIFVNGSKGGKEDEDEDEDDGSITLWGGGFGSAGTDTDCMDFQNGTTSLKLSDDSCATLQLAADSSTGATFKGFEGSEDECLVKNGKTEKPIISYGVKFTDPPDLNITCNGDAIKKGKTLSPGNWPGSTGATGNFPQSGVEILSPGTYCVTGDFAKGRDLEGTEVTIVLKNGSFDLTGGELTLTAPKSGTYKGLVIYMPPTNESTVHWNGNVHVDITGTMLMQSASCDFNGDGQIQKQPWQMICSTWAKTGTANIQGEYVPSEFFVLPPNLTDPSIILIQ